MDLQTIMDEIANRADEFLAEAGSRKEARAGVSELINLDYGHLNAAEREEVADGVMAILEEEEFFEGVRGGGAMGSEEESAEE